MELLLDIGTKVIVDKELPPWQMGSSLRDSPLLYLNVPFCNFLQMQKIFREAAKNLGQSESYVFIPPGCFLHLFPAVLILFRVT